MGVPLSPQLCFATRRRRSAKRERFEPGAGRRASGRRAAGGATVRTRQLPKGSSSGARRGARLRRPLAGAHSLLRQRRECAPPSASPGTPTRAPSSTTPRPAATRPPRGLRTRTAPAANHLGPRGSVGSIVTSQFASEQIFVTDDILPANANAESAGDAALVLFPYGAAS